MTLKTASSGRLGSVVTALIIAVGLLVVVAPGAHAQTVICTGYTTAEVARCDTSGYAPEMNKMHWSMYAGHNCTNYAAYRMMKNGVKQPSYRLGNADTWAPRAKANGVRVDSRPAVGAVGAWPGRQHVVYVEQVGKGYLVISEDAWGGSYRKLKVFPGDSTYPTQFIHFKDLSASSAPTPTVVPGSFIRVSGTSQVYRLIGGAPIPVTSWAAVGGARTTISVSSTYFNSLAKSPADGTFIRAVSSSKVYRVAGSAPIWVNGWASVGGEQPAWYMDSAAITNAGGSGVWSHLRSTPSDRFIVGYQSGRVFRIIAGRAMYVSSWTPYGGARPTVAVDDKAVDGCDHLNCTPFGNFEIAQGGAGKITVRGWAMDPNSRASLSIRVSVAGGPSVTLRADVARPSVDATYHYGLNFGFDARISAPPGTRRVCAVAINAGRGTSTSLGCRVSAVSASPTVTAPVQAATPTVSLAAPAELSYGTSASKVGVTVSAKGVTPAGSVQLHVDGKPVAEAKLVAGQALLYLPADVLPGAHKLSAVFVPTDAKAVSAASSAVSPLAVTKAVAVVEVTTSTTGQQVDPATGIVATAEVSYGSDLPAGGAVTFALDGVAVATSTLGVDGVTTYTLPTAASAGTQVLTATYTGSSTVSASTGKPITLAVQEK